MAKTCFECGLPAEHQHHVVPKSLGGTKTIPLCVACHSKVHGRQLNHNSLVRAALAARRARGLPLGNVANLYLHGSPIAQANKANAQADAERLRPIVEALARDGHTSVRAVARELNRRGYKTSLGGAWHPTTASRLLGRLVIPV